MRYSAEHKEQTRAKLLSAAGSLAKKSGFGTTGVDGFMAAAGMTGGAFYAHFRSKSEFLTATVEHELERSLNAFANKKDDEFIKAITAYLSVQHVENPDVGCVLPALTPEIARSGAGTRQVFEDTMLKLKAVAEQHVADDSAAWPMVCQLVGAVMLARAMESDTARLSLLTDVLEHCRKAVAA